MTDPADPTDIRPYKGLVPFEESDAPFFFGRNRETSLIVANLGSWALQALLLIAVTGAVLALLRVTDPRLRLRTWHGILGAALRDARAE